MYIKSLKVAGIIIFILLVILGVLAATRAILKPHSTVNLNQASVVKEMKSLNRLETASFTLEKIIEAGIDGNAFQNILYGDRILLIAHADVIAGFDLSKLEEDDIAISNGELDITLPSPEILTTRLDNEKTRVYDRRQGLFTKGDPNLESQARLQAEQSIRQAACDAGILDSASENAQKQLQTIFVTAGFEKVTVYIPEGSCK